MLRAIMMQRLFTEHPASVGETYWQHLGMACRFSFWLAAGALACLVHAVLPFLFVKSGSGIIAMLHDRMVVNRSRLTGTAPVTRDQPVRPVQPARGLPTA